MRLVKIVRSDLGLEIAAEGEIEYKPILNHQDIIDALHKKLGEEIVEYVKTPSIDELADLYAVLQALAHHELGVRWGIIVEKNLDKSERKGDFIVPVGMYVSTKGRID